MSKKSFFNTTEETKFNKKTSLSTKIPSSESDEIKKTAMKYELISSLVNRIPGIILTIIGCILIFVKESDINKPKIDLKIIQVSAERLPIGIVFIILGIFLIIKGDYIFKITKDKKKNKKNLKK